MSRRQPMQLVTGTRSYETSKAIIRISGLQRRAIRCQLSVSIGPPALAYPLYTIKVLEELPGKGIKNVAVVCPAFVVDNLETLEEMGMQGHETFMEAGGETFTLFRALTTALFG